jgi:hypothetical protein
MRSFYLYLLAFALVLPACEKDQDMVQLGSDVTAPVITSQQNGFTQVITEENSVSDSITFKWREADFGVATQLTYTVEIDSAGRNFAGAVSLGTTAYDSVTMPMSNFNSRLLDNLKVEPNTASALELRVRAAINGKYTTVSDVVRITVTPWKEVREGEPARLWLPGGYQGWDPANAPVVYAISDNVYEGYVYINSGTAFKFTSAPDWDHINYGFSGTDGILTTDGLADGLSVSTAGYYRLTADTDKLTYNITLVTTWGLVGTASPGGWDASTAMMYDQAADVWRITQDLKAGALKFRANNGWDLNYGPADSNSLEGQLTQTDAAITIPEDGNYTVTLDLSRSSAPYVYRYSVKKN